MGDQPLEIAEYHGTRPDARPDATATATGSVTQSALSPLADGPDSMPRSRRRVRMIGLISWIVAAVAIAAATTGFVLRAETGSKLADTRSALASAQNDLSSSLLKVEALEAEEVSLKARIVSLQDERSGLQGDVNRLVDETEALRKKIDACHTLMKTSYEIGVSMAAPNSASVARFNSAVVGCFGRWPTWLK
jgi:hypothetical protein